MRDLSGPIPNVRKHVPDENNPYDAWLPYRFVMARYGGWIGDHGDRFYANGVYDAEKTLETHLINTPKESRRAKNYDSLETYAYAKAWVRQDYRQTRGGTEFSMARDRFRRLVFTLSSRHAFSVGVANTVSAIAFEYSVWFPDIRYIVNPVDIDGGEAIYARPKNFPSFQFLNTWLDRSA